MVRVTHSNRLIGTRYIHAVDGQQLKAQGKYLEAIEVTKRANEAV